jgi:hypothetical protein
MSPTATSLIRIPPPSHSHLTLPHTCSLQCLPHRRTFFRHFPTLPHSPSLVPHPQALLETRREAEALSLALENPGNQSRWRLLEGKIPGGSQGVGEGLRREILGEARQSRRGH